MTIVNILQVLISGYVQNVDCVYEWKLKQLDVINNWFHPSCVQNESVGDTWHCSSCREHTEDNTPTQTVRFDTPTNLPPPDQVNNPADIADIQLPDPEPSSSSIDKASWGVFKGNDIPTAVQGAYEKIVKWRRNLFKVPTGKIGQEFIEEVAKTISLYTSGSHFESVALTMAMIMFPLLLQKPSANSKCKDHIEYLKKRLHLWRAGELDKLVRQCSVIQERMKPPKTDSKHHEKVFCRLMLQGKISAALRWVGSQQSSLLDVDDDVLNTLKEKHPKSQPAMQGSLLNGPVTNVEDVIFEAIDGNLIHRTAKSISGAAGPSGADAELWQRILCSKQFKKKPDILCESIAELAKKLCCHAVNPDHLQSFTAGRLIPLAKKPSGVRPIGIGEVIRRIVGKAVTSILKPDLVKSTAPIKVCAGLQGGVEAAIHAMRRIYEDPETEAILLVDAENAFNSLNRNVALHNIQYTCPEFSTYIINTYRKPASLFIANSDEEILSEEGTTQGDTGAMGMYACSLMPLVEYMKYSHTTPNEEDPQSSEVRQPSDVKQLSGVKQVYYADDGAGAGKLKSIKQWWETIKTQAPLYGYYPKPSKSWLIVKPEFIDEANTLFTDVNITETGHRYLGSYIGAESGLAEFIEDEMKDWIADIDGLISIASSEPQLVYSAFVYGTSKRWNFVARTTPGISKLLYKLEYHIKDRFIPALIGKQFVPDNLRKIFSLPARLGGLGISNITESAELEYKNSCTITADLADAIFKQDSSFHYNEVVQKSLKLEIKQEREKFNLQLRSTSLENESRSTKRQLNLLSEKGASSWLTSLPLKEYGFLLNKQEFQDAIALRYNLCLSNLDRPKYCICGNQNTINHCLTCKKGGYVSLRHDSLKNITAELLSQVCKDVTIEPTLINVTSEQLPNGTKTEDGAQLDVSA